MFLLSALALRLLVAEIGVLAAMSESVEREHRRADIGAREREVLDGQPFFQRPFETSCIEPRRRCSARARCRAAASCDSDSCRSPLCSIDGRRCKPARRSRRCPKTACRPSARASGPSSPIASRISGVPSDPAERITLRASSVNLSVKFKVFVPHAVNAPSAVAQFLYPLDLGLREDVAALSVRDRQVVHIERVFRADVAAGHAIAAINAGFLLDAVVVQPVLEALVVDSDIEPEGALPISLRALVERPDLEQESDPCQARQRGCGLAASMSWPFRKTLSARAA